MIFITLYLTFLFSFTFYVIFKAYKQHQEFKKEISDREKLKAKMVEKCQKRKITLRIKSDIDSDDYVYRYVFVDEGLRVWNIDYWDNYIYYEKKNRPTKC